MTQGNVIKIGNELYDVSEVFVSASTVAKKLEAVKLAEMARYLREQIPIEIAEIINSMKRIYPNRGSVTTVRRENRRMVGIGDPVELKVGSIDLYTGDIVRITEGEHAGKEGIVAAFFVRNPFTPLFDKFGILTNDTEIALEDITEVTILRHFNTLKHNEIVLNDDAEGFCVDWEKEIKEP